jgi:hypothetical protein
MFPFPIAALPDMVVPGSESFTTPGTYQFTVPEYNALTVTVRGGGGQGFGLAPGYNGGNSSFNGNVIAYGGQAATEALGAGGGASGGDQNYTGGPGGSSQPLAGGAGGAGANGGGAGGTGNAGAGNAPGGGGAGSVIFFTGMPGGGGGGCAVKTYHGELSVGAQITVVVGDGGNLVTGAGGRGARGQVDISWN